MGRVLTARAAIGYVLGSALIMSAMWGFINSSQQLIAEHFGAGQAFPLVFGALALTMAIANFGNSPDRRAVRRAARFACGAARLYRGQLPAGRLSPSARRRRCGNSCC